MKKDDYVKIVAVNGNYRYGYIAEIQDRGLSLVISMFLEGESKIAYDTAHNALTGQEPINYISNLTDIEKRIIPMLATGHDTNYIASEMSINPTTVRAHLRTLRIKLHLDDRAQLIALSGALVLSGALNSMIKKQAKVDEGIKNWQNT